MQKFLALTIALLVSCATQISWSQIYSFEPDEIMTQKVSSLHIYKLEEKKETLSKSFRFDKKGRVTNIYSFDLSKTDTSVFVENFNYGEEVTHTNAFYQLYRGKEMNQILSSPVYTRENYLKVEYENDKISKVLQNKIHARKTGGNVETMAYSYHKETKLIHKISVKNDNRDYALLLRRTTLIHFLSDLKSG